MKELTSPQKLNKLIQLIQDEAEQTLKAKTINIGLRQEVEKLTSELEELLWFSDEAYAYLIQYVTEQIISKTNA